MNIRKLSFFLLCITAALWLAGCSKPKPDNNISGALKGWNCLYSCHNGWNPLDPGIFSRTDFDHIDPRLYQKNKVVLDDAQNFIQTLKASYGFSRGDVEQFFLVFGGEFYEDPSGGHAVKYLIDVKTRMYDTDYTYLLLYDQNNNRTNVMKTKTPHYSRGVG